MKKLGFVFITMVLFSCNSKIEFEKPDDLIGKAGWHTIAVVFKDDQTGR